MAMFFSMALLFVLGSIQGNARPAEKLVQTELMNSPPGQIIIAVVETTNFQMYKSPVMQSILLSREVSVPYKGLICRIQINVIKYEQITAGYICFAPDLGDRYTSGTSNMNRHEEIIARKLILLRGVITRLDIGEYS